RRAPARPEGLVLGQVGGAEDAARREGRRVLDRRVADQQVDAVRVVERAVEQVPRRIGLRTEAAVGRLVLLGGDECAERGAVEGGDAGGFVHGRGRRRGRSVPGWRGESTLRRGGAC